MIQASEFESRGIAVAPRLIDDPTVAALRSEFAEPIGDLHSRHLRRRHLHRRRGGVRGLFARSPAVRRLAASPAVRALVGELLSPAAFAVRAVLFDKHAASNWSIRWHRDAIIAVAARCEVPGYVGWSVKDGVTHVRPPSEILDRMLTVRVHLDDCGPDNGPLLVLPGSHLDQDDTPRPTSEPFVCEVPAGGAVILRPRLWHTSAKARRPQRRRVIHLEFADVELPAPLAFFERIGLSGSLA